MAEPIPPRNSETALSGTRIMDTVRSMLGDVHGASTEEMNRRRVRVEEFLLQQVLDGNVPDFMRPENWRPVTVDTTVGGRRVQATIRVCPDYLAIGSNTDNVRIPLNPLSAQRIADRFGLSLPTARLVDIFESEARKVRTRGPDEQEHTGLLPFRAAPTIATRVTDPSTQERVSKKWNLKKYGHYEGRWMISGQFAHMQDTMIDEDMMDAGNPSFRAGHKKDIIYDPLATKTAGEGGMPVVIYKPGLQPISNIHNELYWDYSHGVRFLSSTVRLRITEKDGTTRDEEMSMRDVLRHREYYRLFSPTQMDISPMYRRPQAVPRKTGQIVEPPVPLEPTRRQREPTMVG